MFFVDGAVTPDDLDTNERLVLVSLGTIYITATTAPLDPTTQSITTSFFRSSTDQTDGDLLVPRVSGPGFLTASTTADPALIRVCVFISTLDEFIKGFQVFDKTGKGLIGAGELRYVLTQLGEKMSDAEVDELLKGVATV